MKLALILDNPYRDLPGLVLVAQRLTRLGHTVYLVPFNLMPTEIAALAPDFVVLPHLKKTVERAVWQILNTGAGVGVLDTEGGTYKSLEFYQKLLTDDAQLRERMSLVCFWGRKRLDFCMQQKLFRKEQTRMTGSPRHDLFHDTWREAALKYSEEYTRQLPLPYVLMTTNFTYANARFMDDPQGEYHLAREVFKISEEEARGFVDNHTAIMKGFIELGGRLAESFDPAHIVLRPHPFESIKPYHQALDGKARLQIRQEGTVEGWILRASALVQRDSTTSIDAAIAGVPVFTPAWLPAVYNIPEVAKVSKACESPEQLQENLAAAAMGHYVPDQQIQDGVREVIDQWYHKLDGQCHVRAAEAIDAAAREANPRIDEGVARCNLFEWQGWKDPTTRLKHKLRMALFMQLRKTPGSSLRSDRDEYEPVVQKWDATGKAYDAQDLERVSRCLSLVDPDFHARYTPASSENGDYWPKRFHGRTVRVEAAQPMRRKPVQQEPTAVGAIGP